LEKLHKGVREKKMVVKLFITNFQNSENSFAEKNNTSIILYFVVRVQMASEIS
jgi:hypothetical protein